MSLVEVYQRIPRWASRRGGRQTRRDGRDGDSFGAGPAIGDPTDIAGLALWLSAGLGVTYVQGPVVAAGTSPPAVTFAGTPSSSTNSIVLTCTAAGTNTTATFSGTLNGVALSPFTAAATVVLPGTGITATFPAGAYTNTPSADTYTSVVTSSAWADQSGNGHNVSQATAAAQPTYNSSGGPNNAPYLAVNGSQSLTVASNLGLGASNFTIFAVQQFTNITGARYGAIAIGTAGTGVALLEDSGRCLLSQAGVILVDGASTTSWEKWTAENSAGVSSLRVNGAAQSLTNSTTTYQAPGALTTIGSGPNTTAMAGNIALVLVYALALSAAQVLAVEAFLFNIYGL